MDQEDHGIFSYRQGANEKYGFDHNKSSFLVLDVTPNINCNLACSICNEDSSSTWTKLKGKKFDIESNLDLDQFVELTRELDLTKVQEINFSGGEPWLNYNIQRYLEVFSDRIDFSQTTLRFSTNGSQALNPRLAKFFQQFRLVLARFSLDDIEAWHEYQRFPSRWTDWETNWQITLQNLPHNVLPSINRTVSVLNIARLSYLDHWLQQYPKTSSGDTIELIDHFAFGPYSLDNLTQSLKDHVLQQQGELSCAWNYVKNKTVRTDVEVLQKTIVQQDQQRGTNLLKADPELYKVIFL
jgi:sulfatase maturation enzyme AslB (radical SAM superfamily)